MKRFIIVLVLAAVAVIPLSAQASASSIGLGVALGAAFAGGSGTGGGAEASFDWGFYVNIPLFYTLHLTPGAELYKLGGQNAIDVDLAFKFIVPLTRFDIYIGLVPGLTVASTLTPPHLGFMGGASYRLVSNLDAFLQGTYKWLFSEDQDIGVFHINAGLQWNF